MGNLKQVLSFLLQTTFNKGFILLIIGVFFGMILEVSGLGVLIPVLNVLFDENRLYSFTLVNDLINYLDIPIDSIQIYLLIGLMIFFFLRSFFLIGLVYYKNRFLSYVTLKTGNKMISNYLYESYAFHIKNSSSKLIKNFQVELHLFMEYIHSFLTFLTESTIALSVIITLIYIEPIATIFTIVIITIFSILFIVLIKKPTKKWGIEREKIDEKIAVILSESITAIREVKIFQKEAYYFKKIDSINHLKASITKNQKTLSQIPRYYFEFVALIGLLVFVIFLITSGKDINDVLVKISVFLVGIFRILPSLNRIIGAYQKMSFHLPSYVLVAEEYFKNVDIKKYNKGLPHNEFNKKIEINKLSFGYKEGGLIFDEINLEIKKGDRIGIVGESGSGKSTLLDLILTLINPSEGEILIDGKEITELSFMWLNAIGYVPQHLTLMDESIKNNIVYGEEEIDEIHLRDVLQSIQLDQYFKRNSIDINKKIGERGVLLSGGQIQRIGIARALYKKPSILILDEATSSLDKKTETQIINSLNHFLDENTTIITISHNINALNHCNRVFEVKECTITEIKRKNAL